VRGSIPTPGPQTIRVGGNTACVELRCGGDIVIIDGGTGICGLGKALMAEFGDNQPELTMLISHTHWDHIQGIPFFQPLYHKGTRLKIIGAVDDKRGLARVLTVQMGEPFFPVGFDELPGKVEVLELNPAGFDVGAIHVSAHHANHPGACFGYRFNTPDGSIAFFPDHEIGCSVAKEQSKPAFTHRPDGKPYDMEALVRFLTGTDILVMDAEYSAQEYAGHRGWGHGCMEDVVRLAVRSGVRELFLFHHDPDHDDDTVEEMLGSARRLAASMDSGLEVEAAREGLKVEVGSHV
jgi:phosphoribosyl 1,2-cyclic phosphodiesterase